jgi:hypothetical protein
MQQGDCSHKCHHGGLKIKKNYVVKRFLCIRIVMLVTGIIAYL